ncbi:MAG: alpha/beta hydrolase [Candidatus Methylomirabilales bacterium]
MAWRRLLKVLGCIMLVTALSPRAEGRAAERITVRAADGTVLVGDLYLPPPEGQEKPPLVVLLHMLSRHRGDWQAFIPRLTAQGDAVFAMDLRGHGESIRKGPGRLSWRGFSRADYARMPEDLLETLNALSAYRDRIDLERVAVIGASIGCNVALVAAAEHRAIRALVLLSPGLDYRGIRTDEAMRRYGHRPILLVASQGDSYAANSTRTLHALAAGPKELKIYGGHAHGTRILEGTPDAAPLVLGWLDRFLPQKR